MPLLIHNTLSRTKEVFEPLNSEHVTFYVCGPTVYDTAHLGNARSFVTFDVLNRVLRRLYPHVTYVRNITDIDDKIIAAAKQNNETIETLTQRTTKKFQQDMQTLGVLTPDHQPKATEYVPHMIGLIETLIAKKHAYVAEGHVLFTVKSFESYGRLSGFSLEEQRAGARVEVAPYKQEASDFVLWKPSPREEGFPGWESPWGYGRPGWHIECSAMSAHLLGVPFDLHGGGQDLIFPHHENEVAQSCCAFDESCLARFWVHNGILTVNGEKMSKSLGNFVSVPQALEKWPAEVVRWALLSAHYRQPLDWTESLLQQSKASMDRLYGVLRDASDVDQSTDEVSLNEDEDYFECLQDDLNTPQAQAYLHALSNQFYKASSDHEARKISCRLKKCGIFLGFFNKSPEEWFQKKNVCGAITEETILTYIAKREQARKEKNFAAADQVREVLLKEGVVLEDSPQGTRWKRV